MMIIIIIMILIIVIIIIIVVIIIIIIIITRVDMCVASVCQSVSQVACRNALTFLLCRRGLPQTKTTDDLRERTGAPVPQILGSATISPKGIIRSAVDWRRRLLPISCRGTLKVFSMGVCLIFPESAG